MTKNAPRIAIIPTYSNDRKVRLSTGYLSGLYDFGAIPSVLPYTDDAARVKAYAEAFDGFLFSGGVDVAPAYYGEETMFDNVVIDEERDRFEFALLKLLLGTEKPILGICRGEQLLNVALGGSLVQHMDGHNQKEENHVATHTVSVAENTRLASILETATLRTNSFHHQAVKTVAPTLRVSATAEDGTIEAVEGTGDRFLLGVQWHPELMLGLDGFAEKIFRAFVDAARDRTDGA